MFTQLYSPRYTHPLMLAIQYVFLSFFSNGSNTKGVTILISSEQLNMLSTY